MKRIIFNYAAVMRYIYLFLLLFIGYVSTSVNSVQGQVLAYEGFDYFNSSEVNINQINNGKFTGATVTNWEKSLGWAGDWIENPVTTVPSNVGTNVSATYATSGNYDLITSGHFLISGNTSIGRKVQNSPAGPFGRNGTNTSASNASNGTNHIRSGNFTANSYTSTTTSLGVDGQTLWLSCLLIKNQATDNIAYIALHSNSTVYDGNSSNHIAIGYFGAASNLAGIRYWSIRINNVITRTTVPVTINTWNLLVAKIDFATRTTVTLYVNPTNIGQGTIPTTVFIGSATASSNADNSFRNIAYYGGAAGTGTARLQSGLDELRIAADYRSVTTASNLIRVEGEVCGGKLGNNIFNNGNFDSYGSTPVTFTANNSPWNNAPAAIRSIDNVAPWTDVTGGAYCYVDDIRTVGSGGPSDGSYTIVNGVRNAWGVWVTSNDYSGTGFMMLANAAFQPRVFFRQTQTGSFCEQTTYEFSVWVKNVDQQQYLTAYGSSGTTQSGFQPCDPTREPGCEQLSQLLGSTAGTAPYINATTNRNTNSHQISAATGCNLFDWYVSGTVGTNTGSRGSYRVLPDIEFIIGNGSGNDVVAYSPPAPIPNDGLWHKIGFTFTTKTGVTTLELKVRNKAPGGGGNDIALDDFSFRACGPDVSLDMINFPACTPATVNTATGTGYVGPNWTTPQYQWQKKSTTGGWVNIPNSPNSGSYTAMFPDVLQGDSIRVNIASSSANLGNFNCSVLSNNGRINCLTPLPVTLLSFQTQKITTGVQLSWQTTAEKNSDYFVVERSIDGKAFMPVCQVTAKGNSSQLETYYCYDQNPADGNNYYRLRQVDLDGQFAYSKVVTVSYDQKNSSQMGLVPNPAKDAVKVVFTKTFEKQQEVLVQITTLTGQILLKEYRRANASTNELELNTSTLAEGMYVVEVATESQKFVQKLIVKR